MAYKIIASKCTACASCEDVCPNLAIREKDGFFAINPKKCTECSGHFDTPQCVAACPGYKTIVPDA
ncbi:MAG: 4Fe-4S ferredoxin iron-sulfur binding protein [Burkholderiaceae bacterium]|nr:4Fe-4S ferredoxin iron-sulfur binding protein [Burkholderiaceae bacterium]